MACLIFVLLFVIATVVHAAVPSAEQYKIEGLEKFGATDEMFSGRMPVRLGPNDKDNLSFFLATHRSTFDNQNDSKLVLVLNECSSNLGILHEHGPYIIETAVHDSKSGSSSRNSKYNLKRNPNSWSEVANVLFLELPIWERDAAKRDDSIKIPQLAGAVRNFIIQFVDVFPQFKGAELYISGESYAGFYVPWIAEHIVKSQLVTNAQGVKVRDISQDGLNLVAVAIGIGESDMCFKQGAEAHRFALDPEIQNKLHIRASDQPGNILLQDPPDRLYSKDLHKWGFCDKKDMLDQTTSFCVVPALQFLIDGFHIDRAVSSDSGAAGARHLRGKDIDSVVRAQPAQVAGARVLLPEMTEVARIEDSRLPDTVRSVENRLTDNPRSVENTLVEEEKPIDFARGNLESIAEDESISFHKRDHGDDLKVTSESTPEEVCFSDRYFQVLNELQENIFAAAAQYDEIERMVHLQNAKSNFVEIWAAKRIQPQLPELPKSALPFPSPLSAEKKAALIEGRIKNAQNELDWWKAQRRTSTDYPWPEFPPADDQKQRFPPTAAPTSAPPTSTPTSDPTSHPTSAPSASPTATPAPTSVPTSVPTAVPTSAFLSSAIPVLLYSDEKTFNTPDIQNILNTNLWRNKLWAEAEHSKLKLANKTEGAYITVDGIFSYVIVKTSEFLPTVKQDLIRRFINQSLLFEISDTARVSTDTSLLRAPLQDTNAGAVLGAKPKALATGGVILAVVLMIAVLWRVFSKEADGRQGDHSEENYRYDFETTYGTN